MDKLPTTAPIAQMDKKDSIGIFNAIGQTLAALVSVLTVGSRTIASSAYLLEKEVIIMHVKQDISHTETLSELKKLTTHES